MFGDRSAYSDSDCEYINMKTPRQRCGATQHTNERARNSNKAAQAKAFSRFSNSSGDMEYLQHTNAHNTGSSQHVDKTTALEAGHAGDGRRTGPRASFQRAVVLQKAPRQPSSLHSHRCPPTLWPGRFPVVQRGLAACHQQYCALASAWEGRSNCKSNQSRSPMKLVHRPAATQGQRQRSHRRTARLVRCQSN